MLRRTFLSGAAVASFARGAGVAAYERAVEVLKAKTDSGEVRHAVLYVSQRGGKPFLHAFGAQTKPETIFLLASITKPMTAAAVMLLVDRKEVALQDPVRKYIPEFTGGGRDAITVRHLLTHTSGLPDMLPENEALRKRHAPLKDFVAGTCKTPLLFKPGAECKYQSMGILLAAEIAERVTKTLFRTFLAKHVFGPLGMKNTELGLSSRPIAATALSQVTGNDDWNWNSLYWRDLGAPWGGAHAPAADIGRLLEYFLEPDSRVLRPETARMMVRDQNEGLNQPWGIGWMVDPKRLGKRCAPGSFGHWGSTGTICWADPVAKASFVLLTTKPASDSRDTVLAPVSDSVSEDVGKRGREAA